MHESSKVALVTGANKGIGFGIARALGLAGITREGSSVKSGRIRGELNFRRG